MIVFIFVIGFNMFYNGFSKIESMAIQKYDEAFEDGKTTTDKGKIATIRVILNKANHLNAECKITTEVKEENGIDIKVSRLVGIYSNTATYEGHSGVKIVPTKVMFDFVCEPVGGKLTTSDSCWVSKGEVLDMDSAPAPALPTRYQAYLDYNGSVHYMDYITKPQFELKMERNILEKRIS